MNETARTLMVAYSKLSLAERLEFDRLFKQYENSDLNKQREIRESYTKLEGPPMGPSCPRCGRSY